MTHLSTAIPSGTLPRERRTGIVSYLALALLIAMRLASDQTAFLAYLGLGIYALLGRGHAIRALALSFLFTMINPGLAPEGSAAGAGRYVVLLCAATSALLHGEFLTDALRIRKFNLFTILLGLLIIVHSFLFSRIPDVSVLKATSWLVATATLLSCWCGMSASQRAETSEQLFWGLVLLLLASLPLLFLPAGYLRNGWAFQGALNHPQAFGPVMALLGAWAATRLFAERKLGWSMMGISAVSIAMVLLSATRTAGLALVIGVAVAIVLGPWFSHEPRRRLLRGLRSTKVRLTIFAIILTGLIMAPILLAGIDQFVMKSSSGGSLLDIYEESRGVLINPMLDNIAENPWTGIGFGVGSDYEHMVVERDPVLGIPSGAPVEKGVTAIAVIEELGFVLAMVVLWWFLVLLRSCARGGPVSFAVGITVLLFNFGEATLFSPGGSGLLWLILLTWAYSRGWAQMRHA